jgi:GH15 family glucan-1,4-alpha-glucosidase
MATSRTTTSKGRARAKPTSRAKPRTKPAAQPVTRVDGYAPIQEYAAIGDGRTLALVARDGSIDWLPLPTLDQGTAFGALLDAGEGGRFHLAPEGRHTAERRYVDDTNVLETTFTTDTGVVRVTDALTLQDGGILRWVELARQVECLSGSVRIRWMVEPRFGYGEEETQVTEIGGRPVAIGKRLRLAVFAWDLGVPEHSSSSVAGSIELGAGDRGLVACVATDNEPIPYPPREEVETRFDGTCESWHRWVDGHHYEGPWTDAVERSALALKLLTYSPSGAMAAAGTTGLPEKIGGSRNFDYRFAWIRDTAFSLDALSRLGYREQVHASLSWLLDVTASTHPRMQPLYGLDGHVPRTTERLPLHGYRGSGPVQRGNGAATQLQLGNYGDLFDTIWHYVAHGNAIDPDTGLRLAQIADLVCRIWDREDAGIWELGQHRHYTISKMSCWLALTRAAGLAEKGQVPQAGVERWIESADRLREFVETRCWSDDKRAYTFYAGTDALDCAVLLASGFGYVDPKGERINSTIDAIRSELGAGGPLLYRYTGMEGEEGCFLACSFWLVSALAGAGRLDEARQTMEELLELGNDVGLYSEEMDPSTKDMLGNFPQALTHLSLIRAAAAVADAERDGGDG